MKNNEIKKMSDEELNKKIISLKKDLFNIRFKKINGQLDDTSKISELKKDLAKIKTKLNNKKYEQKNIKR